jgi:hypothetical protein
MKSSIHGVNQEEKRPTEVTERHQAHPYPSAYTAQSLLFAASKVLSAFPFPSGLHPMVVKVVDVLDLRRRGIVGLSNGNADLWTVGTRSGIVNRSYPRKETLPC